MLNWGLDEVRFHCPPASGSKGERGAKETVGRRAGITEIGDGTPGRGIVVEDASDKETGMELLEVEGKDREGLNPRRK